MDPSFALHIYRVIDMPHMLWKGIWIYHHAVTTCQFQPRFGKSAEILGHCLVVYEALVHWLMLQTHVEWIPPLPQTYRRGLTSFICCGRGYGFIIMLLPPVVLSPDLGSRLKSWVTAWWYMKPLCIGRGSKPMWNGSHIHSRKHIQGI
jgi:hypothetical protein